MSPSSTPASTEGTADLGEVVIRYRIDGAGKGPVVTLANSLGTTLSMWDPQIQRLSSLCRVLRFDQRGHGGSSAPPGTYTIEDLGQDLVALLDRLEIETTAICGVSLGAMTAMWVAAHHARRVTSLVLACTAPFLGPPEPWLERASRVRSDGMSVLVETLLERWFPAGLLASRPDLRAQVVGMLERCDPGGYASCCEAVGTMDLRADLGAIVAPALVVAGADDPVTPARGALALAGSLGAGLLVLPGASHLANLAAPEAFTAAVETHVLGTARARGMSVRRSVLGDAHVDRSEARAEPAAQAFADFITRTAWGEVWSRPGLDRRARSVATLASLVVLGRHEELRFHVPAALRNGLSAGEITEVVLHCAVYGGVPAANSAMAVVLDALGKGDVPATQGDLAPGEQ